MNHEIKRTRRRNGAEIEAVVERFFQSGLSRAEFVQREGICLLTLSRYLKKAGPVSSASSPGGAAMPARFIEVERGAELPAPRSEDAGRGEPYRVSFGHGATLEIPAGFCIREVASLFELLTQGGASK